MTDRFAFDLVVRAIGGALLHSVWQGLIIGGLVALLLRALRRGPAHARYVVACAGLAAMMTAWMMTAANVSRALAPAGQAVAFRGVPSVPAVVVEPASPLADLDDRTRAIRVLMSMHALVEAPTRGSWRRWLEDGSAALAPLWLVGVLILSARLVLSWYAVAGLRRSAVSPVPPALADCVGVLAERLRIRRVVDVVQSMVVHVPTTIGWLRPMVLVPASALAGLTPGQLEAIIAHELAHVRRHDYAVNVLETVADILLFYHPACWWMSRRIRREREHCCDDVAVALCGDAVTYATALTDLESLRSETALALAATDGPLLQRVRRVIAPVAPGHATSGWAGAAVPLAVVALLLVGVQTTTGTATQANPSHTSVPTAGRTIPVDQGVVQGEVVETSSARPILGATVQIEGSLGSAMAMTDAAGRYEVTGLKPGSYSVSATATGYVEGYYGRSAVAAILFGAPVAVPGGHITTGIDVRLHRASRISGRVTDAAGDRLTGVEIELVREKGGGRDGLRPAPVAFAQTMADGSYQLSGLSPGEYYLRAYTSRVVQPIANGQALTYASTFYPGVPTLDEAQPLRLYAGQELLDVDIALGTTRRFRVSGTVSDASGESLDGLRVVLHSTASSGGPAEELSAHVDKFGRFEIRDVAPNTYMVTARDVRRPMRWFSATQTLTVTADVADLEVRAQPGAYLVGGVVRDVGAGKRFAVAGLGVGFEIRVAGLGFALGMGPFRVGADGGFSVESPGGPVVFKVMNVPAGWMVKSIHLDGGEIDDEPIDFGAGRRHVDVVLTDQVSAVSGVVIDRDGRVLPNRSVVVFPANPARWHPSSRFIVAAQSNNVGQFRIEPVPPGDYLAVAVAGLPMNAWTNPDVLSRLQAGAERLRVAEGQRLTIAIRASPTPDGLGARLGGL